MKRKLNAARKLWNAGVFTTSLIEGQIEGSTSIDCQEENELTLEGNTKVTVLHLKPRKCELTEKSKMKKKLCFSNLTKPTSFKLVRICLTGPPPWTVGQSLF